MKRQVRKGVFETNSSSTHAICIATGDILIFPKRVSFSFDDFGGEEERYMDRRTRANYLYTALAYVEDTDVLLDYLSFIKKTLESRGIECEMDDFRFRINTYDDDIDWYLIPSDEGYIDHGRETREFVDAVCTNEDRLLHYLFSDRSYILTGNDNSDTDISINESYPHEVYEKWN